MDFNVGDSVRATWTDGYVIVGKYVSAERGFIILTAEDGSRVACSSSVKLEILESKSED